MKTLGLSFFCIALIGAVVAPTAIAADVEEKTAPSTATEAGKADASAKAAQKEKHRISEEEARKSALASVPDATVRKVRSSVYFGQPVWSVDLKPDKSTRLVNVQVDVYTGRVVSKRLLPPGAAAGRDRAPTKADLSP
jgi:uncharacterized membrane protein YkoI